MNSGRFNTKLKKYWQNIERVVYKNFADGINLINKNSISKSLGIININKKRSKIDNFLNERADDKYDKFINSYVNDNKNILVQIKQGEKWKWKKMKISMKTLLKALH